MISKYVGKISGIESKIAAIQGDIEEARLLKEHPDGIVGILEGPYMIRGKRRDSFFNEFGTLGYLRSRDEVYEIVYQFRFYDYRNERYYPFIISVFPEQGWEVLVGKKVVITKYHCINHYFHKLRIGEDLEVYPVKWTLYYD
jgi:hypothetical protein